MSGIYGIVNNKTDKWYIGQAVNRQKRFNQHRWLLRNGKHANKELQNDWNHYGESAFSFVRLERCDPERLSERERFWVSQKNAFVDGYNQTAGGTGQPGRVMPEAERKWRSEKYSGTGNPFYGKKHTDESRKKMSLAQSGDRHVNYGKHLSEETRRKISTAHQGMHHTEETKRKLSETNKGKPLPASALEKAAIKNRSPENPLCKPVICLDSGEIYHSAAEAARQTGLERTKISACCRGERKSTKGTHWAFERG